MGAHQPFGLVLGLLVWVAKALANVELVLGRRIAAVAPDVRGRHVGQATQGRTALGQLEHPARAGDVDLARLLEAEVERDRGAGVDDLVPFVREPAARGDVEAEPGAQEVAARRMHPAGVATRVAEQRLQDALGARLRAVLAARAYEHVDVAVGELEQASEDGLAEEAGGAGEERGGHPLGSTPRPPRKPGTRCSPRIPPPAGRSPGAGDRGRRRSGPRRGPAW